MAASCSRLPILDDSFLDSRLREQRLVASDRLFNERMKFDIYGRYQLDIVREGGAWIVYRIDAGKRVRNDSIVVPPGLRPDELPGYLDDILHELSSPGRSIRTVP
jgi:hypothetical protein